MGIINANNVDLFYETFGDGEETIVFSHGYLMNHTMFAGQVAGFQNRFRCICFDHRGHGKSEVTKDGYELDNLVTDAIELIEVLDLGKVHFVGMSTGGFVGMRLALRRPDLLKSLVLMDTSAHSEGKKISFRNNVMFWFMKNIGYLPIIHSILIFMFHWRFVLRGLVFDKSKKVIIKRWRQNVVAQNRQAMVAFGKSIFARKNIIKELVNIDIPTAVIVGDKDMLTPVSHAQVMHDTIANSKMYIIADAGHSAAIEKADEVTKAINDFYKSVGVI